MQLQDAVVIDAVRSGIGRSGWESKKGQLSDCTPQDFLAAIFRGLLDRVKEKAPNFEEREIEDVIVGCLSQIGGQAMNIARIASLCAGIPQDAAAFTVNRYCPSGLQAINIAAMSIQTGNADIVLCGGIEVMSHYGMGSDLQVAMKAKMTCNLSPRMAQFGMMTPMGMAAEMTADKFDISREEMDAFGLWSHQKATKAHREGHFADHIVPYKYKRGKNEYNVTEDETFRAVALDDPESMKAKMATLEPRFKKGGKVTAGSSSQIVDGASSVLLMSAKKAEALGLEPICRVLSQAVAGDEPKIMLTGPIPAMRKALDRAGLTMDKMDVIEPNEAFAAPCLAFAKEFGYAFDDPRVNPTGGAIALGHPIGATGGIYFGEMVHEMRRKNLKYGLQTICGGGGVGIATIVEKV